MMKNNQDEQKTVDVCEHSGDVRIYEVDDIENWIQSDTTVDEILEETDAEPTTGE